MEEPGHRESQLLKVGDTFMGAKVKMIEQSRIVFSQDQNEIILSVFNDPLVQSNLATGEPIFDGRTETTSSNTTNLSTPPHEASQPLIKPNVDEPKSIEQASPKNSKQQRSVNSTPKDKHVNHP